MVKRDSFLRAPETLYIHTHRTASSTAGKKESQYYFCHCYELAMQACLSIFGSVLSVSGVLFFFQERLCVLTTGI